MDLRIRETGGPSLARLAVRPDLKAGEPCGRPGCVLDQLSGGQGGPHNKASSLYHGTCKLCGECGIQTEYWGETSFTGYHRTLAHATAIRKRNTQNAFAKHLAIFHPDSQGNVNAFEIRVVATFMKPLPREKSEAVKLHSSQANFVMNSKSEHKQPKIHRVVMTRENPEVEERGGGGRRRRGGGH